MTRRRIDILNSDYLGRFVADQIDQGMTSRDVCYLLEKPWKWQAEFIAFVCREIDENRNGMKPSVYATTQRILDTAVNARRVAIDAIKAVGNGGSA